MLCKDAARCTVTRPKQGRLQSQVIPGTVTSLFLLLHHHHHHRQSFFSYFLLITTFLPPWHDICPSIFPLSSSPRDLHGPVAIRHQHLILFHIPVYIPATHGWLALVSANPRQEEVLEPPIWSQSWLRCAGSRRWCRHHNNRTQPWQSRPDASLSFRRWDSTISAAAAAHGENDRRTCASGVKTKCTWWNDIRMLL